MSSPTQWRGHWDPSKLDGMCGLERHDWIVIQGLISSDPAVYRQALDITNRVEAEDSVWLGFIEAQVRSAMVEFPDTETFYWSSDSLQMSRVLHRYVCDFAQDEQNRRVSELFGDVMMPEYRQRGQPNKIHEWDDDNTESFASNHNTQLADKTESFASNHNTQLADKTESFDSNHGTQLADKTESFDVNRGTQLANKTAPPIATPPHQKNQKNRPSFPTPISRLRGGQTAGSSLSFPCRPVPAPSPLQFPDPSRPPSNTFSLALDDSSVTSATPTLTFVITVLDPTGPTRAFYTFIYIDSPPSLRVFLDRIRTVHAMAPVRRFRTMDVEVGEKCMSIQLHERAGSWEWSTAIEVMVSGDGRANITCLLDKE